MKKFFALLLGIMTGAALCLSPSATSARAATDADPASDYVYTTFAPARYDYLPTLSDLAVSGDLIVALASNGVHIYDNAADSERRHTVVAADTALAVACVDGKPATLDADGLVTVHTPVPHTLNVAGAIDFCFADRYAFVLTEDTLMRIPYGAAGFDPDSALPALAVTRGKAQRVAADATTVAVVAADDTTFKLYTVGTSDPADVWDTVGNLDYVKDVAVIDGNVCYLSEANSAPRVSLLSPKADFELTAGAYGEGGILGASRIAADGADLLIAGASGGVAAVNRYTFGASSDGVPTFAYTETALSSQDSSAGRFYLPQAALPSGAGTFVADTGNNRVQYFENGTASIVADRLNRPFALAATTNTLWVADQGGERLRQYDRLGADWELNAEYAATHITDLALRGDNTLLIADNGSIRTADGKIIAAAKGAEKIAANGRSTDVFYTKGDEIHRLNAAGEDETLAEVPDCIDIDADAEGKIYALCNGGVAVVGETTTMHALSPAPSAYADGVPTSIAIVGNGHDAEKGSLLLAAAGASVLRLVDAATAQAATENWGAFVPPVDADAAETASGWRLGRTTGKADLCEYPSVLTAARELSADTQVFLLSDDASLGFFCQVAAELPAADGKAPTFVTGYLLRASVAVSSAEVSRPFESGYLLHPSAVYKYPSVASPQLGSLAKGADADLVAMPPVTDTAGREWVAVAYEDGIAYLPSRNVLKRHYTEPVSDFRADAGIVADGVTVYVRTDDGYEALADAEIAKGARVMIVGAFDSRAELTHIRYVDDRFGLLDCYVPTAALDPDRLGAIESVAIALIIFTLVIGVIAFCLRKKSTLH